MRDDARDDTGLTGQRELVEVQHPTPGLSDSEHHIYRASEAVCIGEPADRFESEKIA